MVAVRATESKASRAAGSALTRGLELLAVLDSDEALAEGGLGVSRVGELLGREKSQVSRALAALARAGWVERDPATRRYRVGWRLVAIGRRAHESRLVDACAPVLARLVADVGETAHLTVLGRGGVLTVASASPERALAAAAWVGRAAPVWCTASGRALLADEDEAGVALRAVDGFDGGGPNAPRSLAVLLARLRADRRRGYAIADGELEAGLLGIAAPVRDGAGAVVAAVNVSGPKARLGPRRADAAAAVVGAAAALAARLARAEGER
jgi:DNA-binding IclR family transcriptional regulator